MSEQHDAAAAGQKVPVLLLKTESAPHDAYAELFSSRHVDDRAFEPIFVPVLQHRFDDAGTARLDALLRGRRVSREEDASFGGLIFTSQRAVEAFAKLVRDGQGPDGWPHLDQIPIYSVGPATTRALRAVSQDPPLQIFGDHTGNGEALAAFMLDHYAAWYGDRDAKPPLLFLVGEQRRDIIPRTLMDPALAGDRRIPVEELIVYGTGEMASFAEDFGAVLRRTAAAGGSDARWVVVFSPTGCAAMLRALGWLDGQGRAVEEVGVESPRTFVATIGPTTRSFLRETFGFEAHVCAGAPSPEGLWAGISEFMRRL